VRKRFKSANQLGVPRKAWDPSEVAASLGVEYRAVLDLIHAGTLKHFRIGQQYRVPDDALQQYIDDACAEAEQEQAAS
jgi:excisionase family DNA binding protein